MLESLFGPSWFVLAHCFPNTNNLLPTSGIFYCKCSGNMTKMWKSLARLEKPFHKIEEARRSLFYYYAMVTPEMWGTPQTIRDRKAKGECTQADRSYYLSTPKIHSNQPSSGRHKQSPLSSTVHPKLPRQLHPNMYYLLSFYLLIYLYFTCCEGLSACLSVCQVCTVLMEARKEWLIPGTGVADGCELSCECWE